MMIRMIGRNQENLDVIGGMELTPVEVLRAREAELQRNQPRLTSERLDMLRYMVPEWGEIVGKNRKGDSLNEQGAEDVNAAEYGDGHDDVAGIYISMQAYSFLLLLFLCMYIVGYENSHLLSRVNVYLLIIYGCSFYS